MVDEAGLVPALKSELKQVSSRTGTPVRLDVPDDFPALDGDLERAIGSYKQPLTTIAKDPTDDPIYLERLAENSERMLERLERRLAERRRDRS